jgi:CheY-like chemotaxis protein
MERILLVDDSCSARAVMKEMLEVAGYVVTEASNGAEAVQLLVGDPRLEPSLVVLNLEMPTMSGWEFVRIVKSYHRLSTLPLLVVSTHDPSTLPKGVIAGYIRKPFSRKEFMLAVEACLARRR